MKVVVFSCKLSRGHEHISLTAEICAMRGKLEVEEKINKIGDEASCRLTHPVGRMQKHY